MDPLDIHLERPTLSLISGQEDKLPKVVLPLVEMCLLLIVYSGGGTNAVPPWATGAQVIPVLVQIAIRLTVGGWGHYQLPIT